MPSAEFDLKRSDMYKSKLQVDLDVSIFDILFE